VKSTPRKLRLSEAHQAIEELPTVVGRRASSATGSCQESIRDPVESTRDAPAGLAPHRNYSANGAGHDPRQIALPHYVQLQGGMETDPIERNRPRPTAQNRVSVS